MRRIAVVVIGAGIVAVIGELGFREANDSRFALGAVEVTGMHRITRAQVASAAFLPPGRNVWLTDTRPAERRVERIPWVLQAHVHRAWPNRVSIDVVERLPVARIRVRHERSTRYALLDRTLRVLAVDSPAPRDARLPIFDFTPPLPGSDQPGAKLGIDAARALDAFDRLLGLGLRVDELQSRPAFGLLAREHGGIPMLFGNTDELGKKVALFRAISARIADPRRVVYADVRSPRVPTVLYR